MSMGRRFGLFCLLAAGTLSAPRARAAELPIEHFFQNPRYIAMQLSPDGTHVAVLAPVNGRRNVAVIRLADREAWPVTSLGETDVAGFFWAHDNRLVFTLDSDGNESFGLYAVNRDGSKLRALVEPVSGIALVIRTAHVIDELESDPQHVLVAYNDNRLLYPDVYRLNVDNGQKQRLLIPPGNVLSWLADHDGVVRVALAEGDRPEDLLTRILYRANEAAEWQELGVFEFGAPGWFPIDFTADNSKLYVAANLDRDTYAVHIYDPATRTMGEALLAVDGYDVADVTLSRSRHDLMSIDYSDTEPRQHMVDARWSALKKGIDAALPDTRNVIGSMSADEGKLIVFASSDRDPGSYYFLDRAKSQLEFFASRMPWIEPSTMAAVEPIAYTARDGERIHGYLTRPLDAGGEPTPLIIHPHGGPFGVRDEWGFDRDVQFLANRGYSVLQINFRGSGGYGKRFLELGYRQWGLGMQDDASDAVGWAITEGIADPERICIYGASYGGYAAMTGVTQTPELYRCAVSYVGLVDLLQWYDYMQEVPNSDAIGAWYRRVVGDPRRDRERLRATSPVNNVAAIRVPVLVAHGARDPRVPLGQANSIIQALRRADVEHRVLIKTNEGHGFRKVENNLELYALMDRFLKEHLRDAAPAATQ